MKRILSFISTLFLFCYLSCVKEDDVDFKYPKVYTNPISDITSNGARFAATIDFPKPDQITAFGFIWGEDSKLSAATFTLAPDSISGNAFYADIRSSLIDKKIYYVRSFVENSGKTVYGNIVSFKSLGSEGAKITGLNPETAAIGDTIEVIGKNFTGDMSLVYSNPGIYGYQDITYSVIKKEKTKVTFVLPDTTNITTYNEAAIAISIEGNISKSPVSLKLDVNGMTPKIVSITPSAIKACDTITITGKNFKIGKRKLTVTGSVSDLTVIKATTDKIVCIVKSVPKTEGFFLNVFNGYYSNFALNNDIVKLQPEIISVSPTIYKSKDILTVKVKNFPYCHDLLYAHIKSGGAGLTILSRTKDEIKVRIPEECLGIFNIEFGFASEDYSIYTQLFDTPMLSPLPPEILSIEPSRGSFGDVIVIKGNRLKGTTTMMLDTISTSDTEIKGRLNESGMTEENGFVDVGIFSCGSVIKENGFKYDPIEISDFNPKTITSPSQEITIRGKNFSSNSNKVTIGSYTIYLPSEDQHTLIVPVGALMPDVTQSVHESISITIENSVRSSVTSSTALQINYEASWIRLNDFPFSGIYLGISFDLNGKGYVGGNGTSANFWQYDPVGDSWDEKAFYPGHTGFYRVSTSANGKAYVGLQLEHYNEWWEYDPAIDTWNRKKDYPGSSPSGAFAFELGGKVYIGNGQTKFWEYNPVIDSWSQKADIPSFNLGGIFGLSFKGKGYVYTASNGGCYENAYDPNSNTWTSRSIGCFERSANNNYMVFQDYIIIGGESLTNFGTTAFQKIVPGSGNFQRADNAGVSRKGQIGFAIGNYGYWGLGLNSTNYQVSLEMWKFDPSKFK